MSWKTLDQSNNAPTFGNGNTITSWSDVYGNTTAIGVFGIDVAEVKSANAAGIAHAGWIVRKVGTGGRAGRVTFETLVAMGGISTDNAADNAVFPNPTITIAALANASINATSNAVFVANASMTPNAVAILYQWQANTSGTFANIAPTNTIFLGADTKTLTVLGSSASNCQVRVICYGGAGVVNAVTSNTATLTVE